MTKNIIFLDLYRVTGMIREFDAAEAIRYTDNVEYVRDLYLCKKAEFERTFEEEEYEIIIEFDMEEDDQRDEDDA